MPVHPSRSPLARYQRLRADKKIAILPKTLINDVFQISIVEAAGCGEGTGRGN
jgi:hypothetical protein